MTIERTDDFGPCRLQLDDESGMVSAYEQTGPGGDYEFVDLFAPTGGAVGYTATMKYLANLTGHRPLPRNRAVGFARTNGYLCIILVDGRGKKSGHVHLGLL